jgi:hypothetical protein
MALSYYRDLLHMAVCDMAKCSGKLNDRLLIAWQGYLYKFHWDEFEAMLMPEDLPVFRKLKKCMSDDLHRNIEEQRREVFEQTRDGPRPLTDFQISKFANAETVIRAMHGKSAKKAIEAIVEMYSAVVQTVDFETILRTSHPKKGTRDE